MKAMENLILLFHWENKGYSKLYGIIKAGSQTVEKNWEIRYF